MQPIDEHCWEQLPQKPGWTKRRILNVLLRVVGIGLLALIVVQVALQCTHRSQQALEVLQFSTNGVLTQRWFETHIPIPWGKNLLSIDLAHLQKTILNHSQIDDVRLQRVFPKTLRITVREKKPSARCLIRTNGATKMSFITAEGHIFLPIRYSLQDMETYPMIVHVPQKLIRDGQILGFQSIDETLHALRPHFQTLGLRIRAISLKHFDPLLEKQWHTIDLWMQGHWILTFPIQNPPLALKKLQWIFRSLSDEQRQCLQRIDVSLTRPTIQFKHQKIKKYEKM